MNEAANSLITRRQVLEAVAATVAVAGVGLASTSAQAQPAPGGAKTKAVPVFVLPEELQAWTRDLVGGLKQGTALLATLEMAGGKSTNEHLRRFSEDAVLFAERGYVLSDLMAMSRHLFDRDYVTTVRFGEIYGEVDAALERWLAAQPKLPA